MRLSELSPTWIHPDIFAFQCPHCREVWLTIKRIVMSSEEQFKIIYAVKERGALVIHCKDEQAWNFSENNFESMTVTPSLDASLAGHWHGFITNGNIIG